MNPQLALIISCRPRSVHCARDLLPRILGFLQALIAAALFASGGSALAAGLQSAAVRAAADVPIAAKPAKVVTDPLGLRRPCKRANPTMVMTPAQSAGVRAGTLLPFNLTVANNDTTGCDVSAFDLTRRMPAGWTANFLSSVISLSPGASGSTTLEVMSPAGTTDGANPITATATNRNANTVMGSTSATYVVANTVPGAPTIGTATAGNAQATVSFSAPASNGGSVITAYTLTSSPGAITASGTASPLTVSGLTNGTAYTFTVKAANVVGTGAASAASVPVTPAATTTAQSSMKWNPGHYVMLYPSSGASDMGIQLARSPLLRGVGKEYDWNTLEPSRGTYNFTAIQDDLNYLNSLNKKLIVSIRPNAFGSGEDHVPSYITGPTFGGGVFFAKPGAVWAWEPVLWNAAVRDRYILLMQALATQFDSHPALEAIQVIDESAVQYLNSALRENAGVDAFSLTSFTGNLTSIATAARAAFTQTQTLLGFNFPAGVSPDPLAIWAVAAHSSGFGLAAPDVLSNDPWLTNYSYTYLPGLSGVVPLHATVDWMDYEMATVSDMNIYARDSLRVTHIRWQERNEASPYYFDQVVAMLNSPAFPKDVAGGLNTRCPSAFFRCRN